MKTTLFRLMWLATLCWLLAGCTYNRYITMEDESTKTRHITANNTSDQTVWVAIEVNNLESSPKDFHLVVPKSSYYKPGLPAKEKVTIVLRYFDERGLRVKKHDTIITRQTLESDQKELLIDNAMLYGHVSEDCVVDNVTNQTLRIFSNQGHRLLLESGEFFIIPNVPSGVPITFWWEAVNNPRHKPLEVTFTPNPDVPQFYQGQWYGSRLSITGF